jgi:lysylphosphatidylglycerol synthetase-like protein (DUF2156 family)
VTLTLVALVLAVLTLGVAPFATPLYATTHVEVKMFEVAAGEFVERFLQIPQWLATVIVLALLIVAIYLEYFAKIEVGKLPKIASVLALLYSVPLPYIYVVGGGDVVIVLSNFRKIRLAPPLWSCSPYDNSRNDFDPKETGKGDCRSLYN